MDAVTFKTTFPEFSTTADATVTFFIGLAGQLLNVDRWADMLDYGTGLFVAHHLAIARNDQATAASGGTPGQAKGVVTSKSVDKVSVSYDGGLGAYEGAGFWNQTNYGIRFYQLARLVGAGGLQI